MIYSKVFRIADSLDEFIRNEMVDMGLKPDKVVIQLMIWRLSNTDVGAELLERYSEAENNPGLWRNAAAYALQSLTPLYTAVAFCARSTKYSDLRKTLRIGQKRSKLDAVLETRFKGYKCETLFKYIEECRNVMVHSGIMPYSISSGDKTIGLDSFVNIAKGKTASSHPGVSNQDKGSDEDFRTLFFLILASMCFYFDAENPSLSKYPRLRQAGLLLSMGWNAVVSAVLFVVGGVGLTLAGSGVLVGYLIKFLIKAAVAVVLFLVVILVAAKIVGFFNGSNDKHRITDVSPQELVEWLEEMTPYEQMEFMNKRQKDLVALGLYHPIGGPILAPSDSVTERLYLEYKDYPDSKTHILSYLPNMAKVSRIPVIGYPLQLKLGKERQFTRPVKGAESQEVEYMPIYQGDYYPVGSFRKQQLNNGVFNSMAEKLARYPQLDILLLYGKGRSARTTEAEPLELANEMKHCLMEFGVRSKRIRVIPGIRNTNDVTIAVGGF